MNIDVPYGITRRLAGVSLDDARTRTTAALQAEGFGVLTEIDVRATLKKKLDVDFPPYVILGACNPKLARAALEESPGIGLLLPCNVVITADGDDAVVSAVSPAAMFAAVGAPGPAVAAVAADAEQRLRRVMQSL
jgi:uncharacterized protein (DUF302 family)